MLASVYLDAEQSRAHGDARARRKHEDERAVRVRGGGEQLAYALLGEARHVDPLEQRQQRATREPARATCERGVGMYPEHLAATVTITARRRCNRAVATQSRSSRQSRVPPRV